MTTGYVALYTIGGDGLGIASAATDVSLANRNLALGTGSLTATNLTGTLQTAAQTNVTSLGTLTVLNTAGAVAVDGSQRQYHVQLAPVFDSGINVIRAAALAVLSDVRGNSGRVITDLMGIYVSHSFYSYVGLSLTNCYGVYISPGEPSITGAIDNGYGLYVENPVYGVTKRCAHFAGNVSIGSTTAANNRLEVIGGGFRVQGSGSAVASGAGVEIEYNGVTGFVRSRDRGASYTTLTLDGSYINLAIAGLARAAVDASGHFVPGAHNTYDLGTTALRWRDAWVQRAAFNGSDERVKTQIQPTRFGLDFVRRLQPVSWQWKDTSGDDTALHHGFIAQQVKQVLTELGATNQDFGGYHDPEDRKQTGFLALAYNEFISPVVAAVQELDGRGFAESKPAPETSTSPGQRGEFRSSDQYLFACVGENQWKRVAWDEAAW